LDNFLSVFPDTIFSCGGLLFFSSYVCE